MAQDGAAVRAIESLPPPVEDATVWYGPDMMKRSDWIHTLSGADIEEIERAVRPLAECQADIARIAKGDFPLPTLAPKLAAICGELMHGRGFALLRGLPVERWSMREAATAYFGIGSHFGQRALAERQGTRARPRA